MTRTIVITVMLVGMTTMANAADYSWTSSASLVSGGARNCGTEPYPDYKVAVKGSLLMAGPAYGRGDDIQMDLSTLKPDGSGKLTYMSKKNIAYTFEVDAGTGPRKVTMASANTPCKFLYTPK
jgi:hypothetical protein